MIERASREAEAEGVALACQDEAGPFQTAPYSGSSWQPQGHPAQQPHEYIRLGTVKLLTLFRPATGRVQVKGVTCCPNAVVHAWLKSEVDTLLATLPEPVPREDPLAQRAQWTRWQEGLKVKITLPAVLPPLRLLLVWDNLKGHHPPELVLWLFARGVMVLDTPLSGSWLNMAESIQRILGRRACWRAAPRDARADHRVGGGDRARLECGSDPLRLGWQTRCASSTSTGSTACARRIRRLQQALASSG